ncbi:unnamed protein product [Acanthoscelides obtectus]|uniref:Uncharacterized protein n=1 Tax=Acanthoscelides obtectus TaxID=200917 RepID=A0A9P0P9V5_ACAOB|nr:unnamed protein product [Acanthoscelides obtectus]CAK1665247.1 hypothetical protein AOBTE_LOCUS24730 [Acanthoscelides obtectus]
MKTLPDQIFENPPNRDKGRGEIFWNPTEYDTVSRDGNIEDVTLLPRLEEQSESDDDTQWKKSFLHFDENEIGQLVNFYEPEFEREKDQLWLQNKLQSKTYDPVFDTAAAAIQENMSSQ